MQNRIIKRTSNMKEWFRSKQIKQKVRILFVLIILSYFIILSLLYKFVIKESIYDYVKNTNYDRMLYIGNNLNDQLKIMSTMSHMVMIDQEVVKFLNSEGSADFINRTKAAQSMQNIATTFDNNISSVYIFRNDGNYINITSSMTHANTEIMKDTKWYETIEKKAGFYELKINGDGVFHLNSGEPVISFIRVINDLVSQKPIGLIAVNYSIDLLDDTYVELTDHNKKFAYFDTQGNFLCGDKVFSQYSNENSLFEQTFSSKQLGYNEFAYFYKIPNYPVVLAEYEKFIVFNYFTEQSILIIIILILLTVISLSAIGFFISIHITRPVARLVNSMEEVKKGWLKRVSIKLPNDEIGRLKDSYNNMLVEINRLIEELVKKEKTMQQAKLEAMMEQIKPHFLYNTLETIGYLALEKSGTDVYDAIVSLGNFYHNFLNEGSDEITIKDEINIVKNYLKLLKLRYGEAFDDEYLVQEDLLQIRIPKLILQPLVENSLYHGIRPKGEKCLIKITVSSKDNFIYLSVYDNGIGMSKDKIEHFMDKEGKSFGLRKTIERLQSYYNMQDVYKIESKEGYFCEIVLKLPEVNG